MTMIDAAQLEAIGLTPEQARRAAQAVEAGNLRDFVHELLLHGMWNDVVDETSPQPVWIDRWRDLAATGFPIINAAALDRLTAAGVDAQDLTDVVRSAQILTIYNMAQLLDYPALGLGWDLPEAATPHLACASEAAGAGDARRLLPVHPELLARDPSGRFGEPRPLALRQWQSLPEDDRQEIRTLVRNGQRSKAAALWKQKIGGDLRACLDAIEALRVLWRGAGEETT
ncbi:hypothetical protein [Agrobacterium sp. NPDC089420]|uniref:hypothetical protein n=1 Tax=Agrobacterium sp. NPDC089420 TaxID=3363918 RepID=UPI0038502CCC